MKRSDKPIEKFCGAAVIITAVFVAALLVPQAVAQSDGLKEATGDDFNEKLEKRFPNEAKRGADSIFRSIKGDAKGKKEEAAPKKDEKPEKKEDSDAEAENGVKEGEKPAWKLADLFKKKPTDPEEEDLKEEAVEKKAKAEDKKKTDIVAKPLTEPGEKKETGIVAKPLEAPEDSDVIGKDGKSEQPRMALAKLFGKKDSGGEKPSKKGDEPLIEADSLTLGPPPTVEIPTTKSSAGSAYGNFSSWDDVPYKRASTVDRMMGKLNVRQPAAPSAPKIQLPPPLPLPDVKVESEEKPKAEAATVEEKPKAEEKSKKDEPVRFSDD